MNCELYGITQCYLPPGSCDFPAFIPAETGTQFSYPWGMQSWVDLGGDYIPRYFTCQRRSHISETTEQCHDRDSNQRRESHKSIVLTTTLSHHNEHGPCLTKLQLPKFRAFFRDRVYKYINYSTMKSTNFWRSMASPHDNIKQWQLPTNIQRMYNIN